MSRNYLPGTQIEIINEVERGKIKYGLFDFDGTISILREGWQDIMHPVCVEMICGTTTPPPGIDDEVRTMIDETTGIQTRDLSPSPTCSMPRAIRPSTWNASWYRSANAWPSLPRAK